MQNMSALLRTYASSPLAVTYLFLQGVVRKTGGVTAIKNGFRLDGLTVTTIDGGIDIEGQLNGKLSVYNESGILVAEPTEIGRVDLEDGTYIIKICDKSIKLNLNRGVYAL